MAWAIDEHDGRGVSGADQHSQRGHMAGGVITVSEHELSEIRGLIETRSGILFDDSRERFFSSRVHEHVAARKLAHGTDLLRLILNSNVEYDALLQRLLTQETSFFRYPAAFEALEK